MKTEQWIAMLAQGAGAAPRHRVPARVAAGMALGLAASLLVMLATLGLNPGLLAMGGPLAIKLGYVLALALCAGWLVERLARPGAPLWFPLAALGLVLALMAGLAARVVLGQDAATDGSTAAPLFWGRSWSVCPLAIMLLSVLALPASVWALRGLAPTRLRWAGFAAGLLSGSLGALAYALYCTEQSPLFVLTWYSLGMLLPALAGLVFGPRWLRW